MKRESAKTAILKDAAVFIPSSYVAQFFGLINAFVIRGLLGPAMMGIWATLQIVLNYGGYLHMGSMQAGAKEIPYQVGRADPGRAQRVQDNILAFSVMMAACGALVLLAGALVLGGTLSSPTRGGLIAVAFILVGQRVYNFTVMVLRGHKRFKLLSKLTVLTALLDVSLSAFLIWMFGIWGLYGAVVLSLILSTTYAWSRFPVRPRFRLDADILKDLAKIGLPMLGVGLVFTVLRTTDKILIVQLMGATQLGIYSIALMASNYVFGLSGMTGVLTLPRFSERFGGDQHSEGVARYMEQMHRVLGALLPVVLGVLYFLAPMLIRLFLKDYAAGIPAMQTLLLGTFFLCLVHPAQNFLLATGRQMLILPGMAAGVIACAALNLWAILATGDLFYVALATSASYLITFLALAVAARRHIPRKESWPRFLAAGLGPFAYVLAVLALLEIAFANVSAGWVLPLQLLFFGAAGVLPLWRVDRETEVIRRSLWVLREKVARSARSAPVESGMDASREEALR